MVRKPLHTAAALLACLCVVGVAGWNAGAVSAETTQLRAAPTAVAVVNVERALNQLDELKKRNEAMSQRGTARQQEIDKLKAERENLQAKLAELPQTDVDGRRRLQAAIIELAATTEARFGVYQRLINMEKGDIMRPLYLKLLGAVEEVAAKEGYDLVLFDDRQLTVPEGDMAVVNEAIQAKTILYAADRIDITDRVIQLLNSKYSAGAN